MILTWHRGEESLERRALDRDRLGSVHREASADFLVKVCIYIQI